MQIKLFNIPISDNGTSTEEMNRFLRSHKILEVEQHLINNENGAIWCFCARYIQNAPANANETKRKVDYKNLLNEEGFVKFSKLRECRKTIAKEEGIPAYAIFTDEEIAGITKLENIDFVSLQKVKGIGIKKTEKYGERILNLFNKKLET